MNFKDSVLLKQYKCRNTKIFDVKLSLLYLRLSNIKKRNQVLIILAV